MSRKFLTPIDLAKNEIQNVVAQNLAGAPGSPVKGMFYFNSTDNTLYWYDGSVWQPAKSGAPAFGAVAPEPTSGSASADGVASTVSRSDHKHGNPTHVTADHSSIPLSALAVPTAPVSMNGQRLTNVAPPTTGTDAANKDYVDGVAQGLDTKGSVKAASTANLTLSAPQTIDGVALIAGDRVLVKNQTSVPTNGIYTVAAGAWVRATDMDAWAEIPGAFTFVEQGTTQADTGWVATADQGGTLGTTNITWSQFSGAGEYVAGAGLTLTGNSFAVGAGTGITSNADDVAVNFAGTGAAATASRSDHTHTASVAKYYVALPAATSSTVTHNLNSKEVLVGVYRAASPYDEVECDVEHTTVNSVTIRFAVAPTLGEYIATVLG